MWSLLAKLNVAYRIFVILFFILIILMGYGELSAGFWPADLVPHPHLPDPPQRPNRPIGGEGK